MTTTKEQLREGIRDLAQRCIDMRREIEQLDDDPEFEWNDDGFGPYFEKDGWKVCVLSGESIAHGRNNGRSHMFRAMNDKYRTISGHTSYNNAGRAIEDAESWFRNGCKGDQ